MNIIGKAEVTAAQMAQYLINKNPNAKSWALEYAQLYLEEGEIEGVRGDGAWIQSCKETGNFKFNSGTAVTFDQNNFCGLGVTKKGMKGHSFDTPRLGIRAQIQHLKGYATAAPLVNPCIDPRYGYISPKGKAPRFEDLAGKWAQPGYDTNKASSLEEAMEKGVGYGFDIIAGIETMKAIVVTNSSSTTTTTNTTTSTTTTTNNTTKLYYRVQCGAYSVKAKAEEQKAKVIAAGFSAIIRQVDNFYKVQVGAFSIKANAEERLAKVRAAGFTTAFIAYDGDVNKTTTETNTKTETSTNTAVNKKYRIANDAGHGSNTAGKRTVDGYREHWINVKCANYFYIAMTRCGFEVINIAWDDTNATDDADVALGTRQAQIKAAECDASFSWHANAHGNGAEWTDANGIETFMHSYASKVGDSKNLATTVQKYMIKGTNQTNRGVKTGNFAMCNCESMGTKASILIEIGFMTNEYEASLLKSDAFCQECAEEAAQGACEYFGVKYIAPTTTSIKPATNYSTITIPLKITQSKVEIQKFLNKYYETQIKKILGKKLVEDGVIGNDTKLALGIAFQVELNKLGAKLTVDGKIGSLSDAAFDKFVGVLKKGSKGIFVTLWQCIIVSHNINPNGIDGDFGTGCLNATNALFGKIGLVKDSSVSGADLNALL